MSSQIGTANHPLHVAIIGAGPAGFYTADALLKQKDLHVKIDIFDKLPAPYGLVRYGVAPDHQKIKLVTKVYEKILAKPEVRFFGNVNFGEDLVAADLHNYYHQIVYAVGTQSDRRLNISGEDLEGSISSTEFVAWYNGHPDYRHLKPDLSGEKAIVVGAGNVGIDVARVLMRTKEALAQTDIADYALEQLSSSAIKQVHILARRGPAQAKFFPAELKALGTLEGVDIVVNPADLQLDEASAQQAESDKQVQRNLEQLRLYAERPIGEKKKQIHFRFFVSVSEIIGQMGKVSHVKIEHNQLTATADGGVHAIGTGKKDSICADLVVRSVGYMGLPLAGVPYDEQRGIIPNKNGRVLNPDKGIPGKGVVVPGEYVAGWAKCGAVGIIGTNKQNAVETVAQMVADLPKLEPLDKREPSAIEKLLQARCIRPITLDEWRRIDEYERAVGQRQDRPRVKMTSLEEIFAFLDQAG